MGILKKLTTTWKAMTLSQKISLVLDIVSGAGCAMTGITVGNKLSEGKNIVEKICIRTATTGLGLAAAEVSHKALMQNYGLPIAGALGDETAKAALNMEKEAVAPE